VKNIDDEEFYDVLQRNIKNERPAQLAISNKEGLGHSLVADGFKDTEEYHLNFGWQGGSGDAWYFLPQDPDMPMEFSVVDMGVVNIYPGPRGLSTFIHYFENYIAEHGGEGQIGHLVGTIPPPEKIGDNWCLTWRVEGGAFPKGVLVYDYNEAGNIPLANQPYLIKLGFYGHSFCFNQL